MGQTCDDSFLSLMEEKIWKYIMLLILLEWEICHTKTLIAYKSYLVFYVYDVNNAVFIHHL